MSKARELIELINEVSKSFFYMHGDKKVKVGDSVEFIKSKEHAKKGDIGKVTHIASDMVTVEVKGKDIGFLFSGAPELETWLKVN